MMECGDERSGEVGRGDGDKNLKELGRLPIVGVFHKMAHERGVPHSFTSKFIAISRTSGSVDFVF